MIFKGVSLIFKLDNEKHYHAIGEYWDLMAGLYGRENLQGLGYNRTDTTTEYVIGFKSPDFMPQEMPESITEIYPKAVRKEIALPDYGWELYMGRTAKIGEIYYSIYRNGPVEYQLEHFTNAGDCILQVFRG